MGYSPQQVDRMSLWQFSACIDGWLKANGAGGQDGLTKSEADEIWAWMNSEAVVNRTLN